MPSPIQFRIAVQLLLLLAAVPSAALALDLLEPAPPKPTPDIYFLDATNTILLAMNGRPIAAAQIRPAKGDGSVAPVLALDAAKAALAAKDAIVPDERLKEVRVPAINGKPGDRVNVLWRTRKISNGARVMLSSSFSGPSLEMRSQGAALPRPTAMEMAVQIYPDAKGAALPLAFVDGVREPEASAVAVPDLRGTKARRRARGMTFEGPENTRTCLSRSGPAEWASERAGESTVLAAPLLADPREPAIFGSFILYLGAGVDEGAPEISPLKLDKAQTPARDFVEGSLRVYASEANPFVLSDVAVIAEIAMPPRADGTVPIKRLPCFFWEAPSTAPAEGEFRFRFAPPSEGVFGVRIQLVSLTGQAEGNVVPVRAVAPATAGFVRTRKNQRRFLFEGGAWFLPMGADLTGAAGFGDAESHRQFFIELARHGGNTVRVSIAKGALALEPGPVGALNPTVAQTLDEILRAAQARGVYVVLTIENGTELGTNSAAHPYFRELGGPLSASPEFFRDPIVKRLYQSKLTYLAARYSAYRSLLAWELMCAVDDSWPVLKNDPENAMLKPEQADVARRGRRDVQDWADEMALYIKGHDEHDHPVCISAHALDVPWADLYTLQNVDFVLTDAAFGEAQSGAFADETKAVAERVADARKQGRAAVPQWPLYFGPRDAVGGIDLFHHNVLFSSLAGGMAGAPFEPLPVSAEERARFFKRMRGAAVLGAGLRESARPLRSEPRVITDDMETPSKAPLRLFARFGRRGVAAWVQDRRSTWTSKDAPPEVGDAVITLPGLVEGNYEAAWIDTRTGEVLRVDTIQTGAAAEGKTPAPLVLKAPAFKRDIAVAVARVGDGK